MAPTQPDEGVIHSAQKIYYNELGTITAEKSSSCMSFKLEVSVYLMDASNSLFLYHPAFYTCYVSQILATCFHD